MTVRLARPAHQMIDAAATREGVPLAQYVREAALMRVTWELGLLHGRETFEQGPSEWLAVVHEVRALMGVEGEVANGNR